MNSNDDHSIGQIKTGFDLTKVKEALAQGGKFSMDTMQHRPAPEFTQTVISVDGVYLSQLHEELHQLRDLVYRLRKKNRNQKMALRQLNDAMIRKSWNLGKALVDRQSLEAALDAMFGIKVIK